MKSVSIAVAVVSLSVAPACAFSFRPARTTAADTPPQTQEVDAFNLDKHAIQDTTQGLSTTTDTSSVSSGNTIRQSLLAGCMTFLTTSPLAALAAADDLELEELPPVYVPIIFAIFVLGGVGVLTASLGNVMDEEASLGLQSGARAKKERDRSRSSYFKK